MRVIRNATVAVALVASCIVLGVASPASAKSTLMVPSQYSTIQAAVDAAKPGDTVLIAPGTYHEQVNVTKDNITIKGDNSETESIVIDGDETNMCGICVGRQDDVVVKNV